MDSELRKKENIVGKERKKKGRKKKREKKRKEEKEEKPSKHNLQNTPLPSSSEPPQKHDSSR